eukprot:Tbor_TRINITY_DN5499_c1_g1::TRINITY_DN5499_c1_g1_i1::g.25420::m.25420
MGFLKPGQRAWRLRSIVKKDQLLMPGSKPYGPPVRDRVEIVRQRKLQQFHYCQQDGVTFAPLREQPPWKRSIPVVRDTDIRNYKGLRVATVTGADEPGFPTHFR